MPAESPPPDEIESLHDEPVDDSTPQRLLEVYAAVVLASPGTDGEPIPFEAEVPVDLVENLLVHRF